MNGFDLSTISNCYVGGTQVSAIYLGSAKIWPKTHDYSRDYLTFEALQDGTFQFTNPINYSTDDGTTWTSLAANTATPTILAGDKILWKATLTPPVSVWVGIGTFSSTGNFNVEGNVMSLLYGDNFIGQTDLTGKDKVFARLFRECSKLLNAIHLSLPATTLANECYWSMFSYCTSIVNTPALPATTLVNDCYASMFHGCTSLTTAPELPAITLADGCYGGMFYDCTSLTTAPELPATTLTFGCYQQMFWGCTSLTTAPELPTTTLTGACYNSMFYGCTSLNYVKCLATDISASGCTNTWLSNVSATGTFVKATSMNDWTTGTSGIPTGWTVLNA